MGFEFDEQERATFRKNLEAAVRQAYPEALVVWMAGWRRKESSGVPNSWEDPEGHDLVVTLGEQSFTLYEPNFFFSMPSWTEAEVIAVALDHLKKTFSPDGGT